jgi:hypothetical protein
MVLRAIEGRAAARRSMASGVVMPLLLLQDAGATFQRQIHRRLAATFLKAVLGHQRHFQTPSRSMEADGHRPRRTMKNLGDLIGVEPVPSDETEKFSIRGTQGGQCGNHQRPVGHSFDELAGAIGTFAQADQSLEKALLTAPTPALTSQGSPGHG